MEKTLFRYSSKFRLILVIILGLIASFQNIIMANVMQALTNTVANENWSKVTQFLTIIIAALVVTLTASLIFNKLKTNTIEEISTYLRTHILDGMLEESKSENNDSLGFLTNDFKLLETNRFNTQTEIIMQIFSLVLAPGYTLAVNWLLALLFLAGSSIPMVISSVFQKLIRESSEKWTGTNSKYVNQTKNFLAGIGTLHLYNGQNQTVAKNKQTVSKLRQTLSNMNLLNLDTDSWINFVGNTVTFLMPFLFGIYSVVKGRTSLGALFAIMQLVNSFIDPVLFILDDRGKLSATKKIVKKVNDFLDKERGAKNRKVVSLQDLRVKDLILKRDGKQLATGTDLNVDLGKKVAVIGPSGAEKSTSLQFLLYGKYGKAEAIRLNDKRVKAGTSPDLFSYASQAPVIFTGSLLFSLTLEKNISREKVKEVCDGLDLGRLVKEKGFGCQLGEAADRLSDGQLARTELAKVILMKRPVLLLDRINASLDRETSDIIHRHLLILKLAFIEMVRHYEEDELKQCNEILDLKEYI